jgi:nucleoside-diphosphate-sugar epimerase
MKVLVTGGSGFLGSYLVRELLRRKEVMGRSITRIVSADLVAPSPVLTETGIVMPRTGTLLELCRDLKGEAFDVVFHLAAAVSAECEADFDLGMRANLDSTRALLDTVRATGNTPRFFFASTVAVFGSDPGLPMPAIIGDDTLPTPQSSYGIQKFIGEQLVADYTRRGFIEGRTARLMTVTVRPGPPNGAASSFLSAIVREPLAGREATYPVPLETAVAISSPANAIAGLLAVAEADPERLGGRIAVNLPALTVTVNQMLDALLAVGGDDARRLVRFEPDITVARIVAGWPYAFANTRAAGLGLLPDTDFEEIIRQYVKTTSPEREQ